MVYLITPHLIDSYTYYGLVSGEGVVHFFWVPLALFIKGEIKIIVEGNFKPFQLCSVQDFVYYLEFA